MGGLVEPTAFCGSNRAGAGGCSAATAGRVAVAIGGEDAPMRYLLGEKYIHAIGNLAKSDNAKTVLIPADIQDTLRGILGSRK